MTDERLGPPPVEPMSDVAWARVERNLWSRMDTAATAVFTPARSRRWVWIAAPALVAAAAIVIVIQATGGPPSSTPKVGKLAKTEDDLVRFVSHQAPSSVSVGDAHVTLDPESAVVMPRAKQGPSAILERGAATFAISPRTGRPFVVAAGDTTVRVVGTKFRVARAEEIATVEVEHGIVEVTFRGVTRTVSAGEAWRSAEPSEVFSTRTAEVEMPPDEVAPESQRVRRTPKRERPTRDAKPEPTPVPTGETDQQKYERFAALEVRDPRAAITGYLGIARGTGKYAELALYAAGRLAADRGEQRAATLLKMYLTRFPNGKNVDDAVLTLDRIQGDR